MRNLDWLKAHATYDGDACLLWPFGHDQDGYGVAYAGRRPDGKKRITRASRIMCEIVHGEPPTSKHVAAHTCGKGHTGCVNPKHLVWKTARENERDKFVHGTYRPGSKASRLTKEQIAHIRASKGIVGARRLGKLYGISRNGIRYWQDSTHDPVIPKTCNA